jgi:signal transduction histidine kinase
MGLFWKIFVSFGIAMTLALVGAVLVSFRLASDAFDQVNIEGRERIIQEVAAALAEGGEPGLKDWLRQNPRPAPGIALLVLGDSGGDLLGRALPRELARLLRTRPFRAREAPPNVRPLQLTPHLVGADGSEYRLLFVRAPVTLLGILTWPGTQLAALTIGVVAAGLVSLLLAGYLSRPIVRLQRASRALAAGALHTRVGSPSNRRRDEVGRLARDFDTMAERIEALVTDKETLLRDVSHEFRSPLARIRVALALAERNAGEGAQANLQRIERECEQLDELVEQVMTLTRLSPQASPPHSPVKLHELVAQVVEDARYEHPDAEITFLARAEPEIFGAPGGIKSAVENVLRNALDHNDPQYPVELELEQVADAAVLRVADRGEGVPEADLARIFEPFFRSDLSRDHRSGGYGIGLAITARVIALHGGHVEARNRPEGGLVVTLTFPTAGGAAG